MKGLVLIIISLFLISSLNASGVVYQNTINEVNLGLIKRANTPKLYQVNIVKSAPKKVIKKVQLPGNIAKILTLTNEIRQNLGLNKLVYNEKLAQMASIRSVEIATLFAHVRPNGKTPNTLLEENNISYQYLGENLAFGYNDAKSVVEAWCASLGHYQNIIRPEFCKIGIGLYEFKGNWYVVELFTN